MNTLGAIWMIGIPIFSGLLYTVMVKSFRGEGEEDSIEFLAGVMGLFWPIFFCAALATAFPLSGILIAQWLLGRKKDREKG